jgi:hypothetical protein
MVSDTFDGLDAYNWVVPAALYDAGNGPDTVNGVAVEFKTKNGLTTADCEGTDQG